MGAGAGEPSADLLAAAAAEKAKEKKLRPTFKETDLLSTRGLYKLYQMTLDLRFEKGKYTPVSTHARAATLSPRWSGRPDAAATLPAANGSVVMANGARPVV